MSLPSVSTAVYGVNRGLTGWVDGRERGVKVVNRGPTQKTTTPAGGGRVQYGYIAATESRNVYVREPSGFVAFHMAPWTMPAIHKVTVNRSCPTRISQRWTFASFTLWSSRPALF